MNTGLEDQYSHIRTPSMMNTIQVVTALISSLMWLISLPAAVAISVKSPRRPEVRERPTIALSMSRIVGIFVRIPILRAGDFGEGSGFIVFSITRMSVWRAVVERTFPVVSSAFVPVTVTVIARMALSILTRRIVRDDL